MRGCVVILVDESAATDVPVSDESPRKKSVVLATTINSLCNRLSQGPDFDLALVGYRKKGDEGPNVGCRWSGPLAGREFVPTSELAASPVTVEERTRRVPDPLGGMQEQTVDFPIWYQPTVGGEAPHTAAFEYCRELISRWAANVGAEAGQPLVLNVFVGASSDGNPDQAVQDLQQMPLPSGSPLVFQAHIIPSKESAGVPATLYPSSRAYKPGPIWELFERTSLLPDAFYEALAKKNIQVKPDARGMIGNARFLDVARFLSLVESYAEQLPPSIGAPMPGREPAAADAAGPTETAPPASEAAAEAAPLAEPEPTAEATPSPEPMDEMDLGDEPLPGAIPGAETEPEPGSAAGPTLAGLSAEQPGLVLFVLDRSVADPDNADLEGKNACARLHEHMGDMVEMIAKFGGGAIDVGVISYGSDSAGESVVRASLEGGLATRPYARDNELVEGAVRVEAFNEEVPDGAGGFYPKSRNRPVLVEVEPAAAAPAMPAFEKAAELISAWCQDYPHGLNSPIVVHLTRGELDAVDAEDAVAQLQSVASGAPVAVYHVVETESKRASLLYPADESKMEDEPQLQILWRLSSPLLEREALAAEKSTISDQARGFVVNGRCKLLMEGLKRAVVS